MVAGFAALDVEVVAIVFLFALLAGVLVVRPLLVGLANQLPVVGPALAARVDSVVNAWLGAMTGPAQGALGAFTSVVSWLDSQGRQLVATVSGFAQLTYTALYKIENVVAPALVQAGVAQAGALLHEAMITVYDLFASAEAVAARDLAAAEAQAGALFTEATTYAQSVGTAAEQQAGALFHAAESDAQALAGAERAFAVAAVTGAENYAQALYTDVITRISAAEAVLGHDIGAVAEQERAALGGAINSLTGSIDTARAAAIAAAGALVVPLTVAIRDIENSRCMQQCNVLGAIGEGMALLDLAAILALVAAAQSDPGAVQQFFTDEVAPAVRGIAAAI